MASEKISQLPVTTTSTNGDLYTLVQGGVNKSITFTALQAAIALTPSSGITQLTGDVSAIGPGVSAATVNSVGGQIASAIAAATVAANAATFLDTPSTIVARDTGGNFSAGTVTASLVGNVTGSVSGSSSSFTGSLGGDVTGTQSATTILSTVVTGKLLTGYTTGTNSAIGPSDSILGAFEKLQAQITGSVSLGITALTGDVTANGPGSATATVNTVGGQTAANVATATVTVEAATSSDTVSTLVKRDASGNFSAGTISAIFVGGLTGNVTGNLTGNVTGNVSGSSASFTGNLSGDVTGTQGATVVSSVGGQSASAVNTSVLSTEAATSANVFSTIVKRDTAGDFSATTITSALIGNVTGNVTGNVSGSSSSFTGSLSGDVTGTQGATVVSLVGGESAAAVAASVLATQAATNLDTASTIVKRDASGNFSAGTVTANLTGNVSGSSSSFTGSLSGDVSGTQSATLISVGAVTDTKASLADKPSIGVVATSNEALSGLPTIDGIAVTSGMLVLLAAQSTPSQNGPWVAQAGAWSRPTWYPSAGTTQAFAFITCLVRQGVLYQGTTWFQTAAAPITIDTTPTGWLVIPFALSGSTVTGILPNANTTATSLNTASAIITRDSSGNFAAGSATFAGTVAINGSSLTALEVGTNVLTVDTINGAIGVNTAPSTLAIVDAVNNSGSTKTIQATGYGGTVGFRGRYANGTLLAPTAAISSNVLNLFSGRGWQGSTGFASASTGAINIVAGETFTTSSNATYISFFVTPTGSITSAEAVRLNSTGNLLIGTTTDSGTQKLQVDGNSNVGTVTAGTWNGTVTTGSSFLTTGTTYTTPANITTNTNFKFTLIGGGAGGSSPNSAADHGSAGGAGGGLIVYVSGLNPSTAYSYMIGSAGTGGTGPAVGNPGGSTTLTIGITTYTAGGGSAATTTTGNGGVGGSTTNGTINVVGQQGGGGATVATAGGGGGGDAPFGFGLGGPGLGAVTTGNGISATGFGGAGGGAAGAGAPIGGSGTAGCILVEWQN